MLKLLPWFISLTAGAQVICALGPGAASYKNSEDQRPSADAMQLAGRVNRAVKSICGANCPAVMLLRNATSAHVIFRADAGQAKLVYEPRFFAAVHGDSGDAGVIAVIAHAFGHALDDTMGAAWIQRSWTPELRADAWAGCILAKSDLSESESRAFIATLAKYPSASHPAWTVRLPVLSAGYSGCGGGEVRFNIRNGVGGRK
jgi:hypothetical protein